MAMARRHGFSPNVKPFCPSPSMVSQSVDGLSASDVASCSSTPKLCQSSPCLSTPGCNPLAKPFLPQSQKDSFALPTRAEEKGSIALHRMLELQASAADDVVFADSVPQEVIAAEGEGAAWLVRALQGIPGVADDAFKAYSDVPAEPAVAADEGTSPSPAPLQPQPMTSLSFLRSRKAVHKTKLPRKGAKPEFVTLSPAVCA